MFLKMEKTKKLQYGPHQSTNFPEGKKQRLVEYRKIYSRKQKKMNPKKALLLCKVIFNLFFFFYKTFLLDLKTFNLKIPKL